MRIRRQAQPRSRTDSGYGLEDKDFADITHLYENGAVRFTRKEFGQLDRHKQLGPKPIRPLLSY
jgi:hypothetical protein